MDMDIEIVNGNFKADVKVIDIEDESRSTLDVAGSGLQAECATKYPNGIKHGELTITQGLGPKCERVYHVSICEWSSQTINGRVILSQVLTKCLEQAHQDKMTSIAIPTLGCGLLGYPPAIVAETLKQCIEVFEDSHKETSLSQIYVVVDTDCKDWEHVQSAFEEALLSKSHPKRMVPSGKNRGSGMNPEKLKKLQAQVRIGGKGTARRKKKIVPKKATSDERKLQNEIQKTSEVELTEIDEVNIIKDDGEVIHFENPIVQASRSANMFAINGHAEHKDISEMMPNIIPQLGMDSLRYVVNNVLGIGSGNAPTIEPCNKVLSCGHLCSGIKDEKSCPPCLQTECCINESGQTVNDYCMICFIELFEAPVVQLKCGHVYHLRCTKDVLKKQWSDARISFRFTLCPICQVPMEHTELESLLKPIKALHDEVMERSMLMFNNEGLENSIKITDPNSFYFNNPKQYAMDRYSFYQCNICKKPYFGGVAQCEGGAVADVKVEELVCPPCSGPQLAKHCDIHGTDFLYFKCRYCCSVAVFFCFGTSHFCNACHTDFESLIWRVTFNMLPKCPAGPSGKQLSGACPLRIQHSPNGTECCLGCELCAQ